MSIEDRKDLINGLRRELKYYQKRKRYHLANLEEEIVEYYNACLNEGVSLGFDELPYVQLWNKQISICDDVIRFLLGKIGALR